MAADGGNFNIKTFAIDTAAYIDAVQGLDPDYLAHVYFP